MQRSEVIQKGLDIFEMFVKEFEYWIGEKERWYDEWMYLKWIGVKFDAECSWYQNENKNRLDLSLSNKL